MSEKQAKHTPGPWTLDDRIDWLWAENPYGQGNMHVADVTIRGWGHLTGSAACNLPAEDATEIQKANARLIAAAPELLEAIKGLLDGIERTPCHCHEAYTGRGLTDPDCIRCGMDLTSDDIDAARAAIAKATGGTER